MRIGEFDIAEPAPELHEPHMLAVLRPWIDVGNVGSLSLGRIERHLRSQELGRLYRPGRYYDFTRYRPRSYLVNGRREVTVPNTIIRYANPEDGQHLLTAHLLEPHLYGEDYSDALLEIINHFGVKQYALIGGMYDMVPHTRPLVVSGLGTGENVERDYRIANARTSSYEGPTTITYTVSQTAAETGSRDPRLRRPPAPVPQSGRRSPGRGPHDGPALPHVQPARLHRPDRTRSEAVRRAHSQ